jgi:hypothetical protein
MHSKIDKKTFPYIEEPNTLEKLAFQLAAAIDQANQTNPKGTTVSWEAQETAIDFLNTYGLAKGIDKLHSFSAYSDDNSIP